ncbi:hypothetical protein Fmac_010663 [Flemingia macrophylla]|uniref:Uncharacterized protein n=1 Tax=Flemingia macrophylla TaxID=520843 RepID=A0ABD1MK80_9FABA
MGQERKVSSSTPLCPSYNGQNTILHPYAPLIWIRPLMVDLPSTLKSLAKRISTGIVTHLLVSDYFFNVFRDPSAPSLGGHKAASPRSTTTSPGPSPIATLPSTSPSTLPPETATPSSLPVTLASRAVKPHLWRSHFHFDSHSVNFNNTVATAFKPTILRRRNFRLSALSNDGSGGNGAHGDGWDGPNSGGSEGSNSDGGDKWSLLSWYSSLLGKYRILVKYLTSAILTLFGDLVCQVLHYLVLFTLFSFSCF